MKKIALIVIAALVALVAGILGIGALLPQCVPIYSNGAGACRACAPTSCNIRQPCAWNVR